VNDQKYLYTDGGGSGDEGGGSGRGGGGKKRSKDDGGGDDGGVGGSRGEIGRSISLTSTSTQNKSFKKAKVTANDSKDEASFGLCSLPNATFPHTPHAYIQTHAYTHAHTHAHTHTHTHTRFSVFDTPFVLPRVQR
jgi:hypothetical protein